MSDHSKNALIGMCSALREIVRPGVRDDNPLAIQELAMVIRYLEFLETRIELLHERFIFELRTAKTLASGIAATDLVDPATGLAAAVDRAATLLASPNATTEELREATETVELAVTDVLEDVYASGDPRARELERLVIASAGDSTVFERAWYLPLGMDHFADEVPPLESLLAKGRAAHG